MDEFQLTISDFAYGGAGLGRDKKGRPVFVQGTIPGEKVRVATKMDKGRYLQAELLSINQSSKSRVQPLCPHFERCSGCHYQHMEYHLQLRAKREVVQDQLQRIGKLKKVKVKPTLANPHPYGYAIEINFSPTSAGELGYWSAKERQVIPIDTCPILKPQLLALFQDIDLNLPELRKLTLRLGTDGEMLAGLEVEEMEPPELAVDFPVSVAIILPDRNAASLIGNPYLLQEVKGRQFRVSPGCFFHPSIEGAELVIDTMLSYADLDGSQTVLDAYSGIGLLTAFLSEKAQEVIAVEVNDDAAADFLVNLDHTDNVSLYHGLLEEILPAVDVQPQVMIANPGWEGLNSGVIRSVKALAPDRFIYISSDAATMARDAKELVKAGFGLFEVQPIDMVPQNYRVDTVSLWLPR